MNGNNLAKAWEQTHFRWNKKETKINGNGTKPSTKSTFPEDHPKSEGTKI